MPEHIHLLLSEPERDTFADALKSLKQGVARHLIGDADHFWQKHYYYNTNVRNHAQFVEKLHYIHCDAVTWNCPTQAKIGLEWATRGETYNSEKYYNRSDKPRKTDGCPVRSRTSRAGGGHLESPSVRQTYLLVRSYQGLMLAVDW